MCANVVLPRDPALIAPLFLPPLQTQLSLKALWKQGQEAQVPTFLAAASLQVPCMATDFHHLAQRLQAHLGTCPAATRAGLLNSHRYLSCIDLQSVNGQHHQGSPGLESMDVLDEGLLQTGV